MTTSRISSLVEQTLILVDYCFKFGKVLPKNVLQLLCRVNGGRFISTDDYRKLEKMATELKSLQRSSERMEKEQKQNIHYPRTQIESERQSIEKRFEKQKDKFSNEIKTFKGGQI